MPVGGFPGPLELGLRRRRPLRPVPRLRPAGRPAPPGRRRPRGRPRRAPGLSSTTTSVRTATTSRLYSDDYFTDRHQTPWGDAINYDGAEQPLRARLRRSTTRSHWIREYHIDGLRLDATDTIVDDSPVHILQEIAGARPRRRPTATSSSSPRRRATTCARSARSKQGATASTRVWADDFHHEVRVYLTDARENYYANYVGSAGRDRAGDRRRASSTRASRRAATGKPRGTKVTDEPATAFVFCIQNHDQVGNRPFGERLHHDIDAEPLRASPRRCCSSRRSTPLLFMGQEFAASTPFLFFTDHNAGAGQARDRGAARGVRRVPRLRRRRHARAASPIPRRNRPFSPRSCGWRSGSATPASTPSTGSCSPSAATTRSFGCPTDNRRRRSRSARPRSPYDAGLAPSIGCW